MGLSSQKEREGKDGEQEQWQKAYTETKWTTLQENDWNALLMTLKNHLNGKAAASSPLSADIFGFHLLLPH